MKKIAFITGGMTRGGGERVLSILSKYYAERGYQTEILCLLNNEVGYELHKTTKVVDLTGKGKSKIKRLPYWIKSLKNYVKESKPDVVLSFFVRVNVVVLHALRKFSGRIIVSERIDPSCDGRSKIVSFLTKRLYPKANAVVFQTERAKNYFRNLKNGVVIPNPINVENKSENVDYNKIVTMGRLTDQKNQKLLISAFSYLASLNQDAYLQIYGEGELKEELQAQIDSLSLTNRVTLMGNHPDVIDKISDAGIFCLPSNYEGLSNALLEAMMLGLPCISTNCAGADETIVDGENGYLVEVGNEKAFSEKLIKLFNDREIQAKFSKNAKITAEKFKLENVMVLWNETLLGDDN